MRSLWLILAAALLAWLAFAAGARVASAAPFTPEVEAEYQAAVQWWGQEPTCRSFSKVETDPVPIGGVYGEASVGVKDCWIKIARDLPPCLRTQTMRHEVGHLLGHEHDADPASIMYPYIACPSEAVTPAPPVEETSWEAEQRQRLENLRSRCRQSGSRRCWGHARFLARSLRSLLR